MTTAKTAAEHSVYSTRAALASVTVALVLLVRSPRELDAEQLADLAGDALGGQFTAGRDDSVSRYVVGEVPSFILP